jgi:hypothetical protein
MAAISTSLWFHPRGWVMVPVTVCGIWNGNFILNTFRPRSTVSAMTATVLNGFECIGHQSGRDYVLRGLMIGGERLPELDAQVSAATTLLGVEGMLGLNFFRQFSSVHLDVDQRTLTLELR